VQVRRWLFTVSVKHRLKTCQNSILDCRKRINGRAAGTTTINAWRRLR
jgi:hypothetical protein